MCNKLTIVQNNNHLNVKNHHMKYFYIQTLPMPRWTRYIRSIAFNNAVILDPDTMNSCLEIIDGNFGLLWLDLLSLRGYLFTPHLLHDTLLSLRTSLHTSLTSWYSPQPQNISSHLTYRMTLSSASEHLFLPHLPHVVSPYTRIALCYVKWTFYWWNSKIISLETLQIDF